VEVISDSDDDSQYRNENNETDFDFDSSEGNDVVMRGECSGRGCSHLGEIRGHTGASLVDDR